MNRWISIAITCCLSSIIMNAQQSLMVRLYAAYPSQRVIITTDSVPYYLLAFDRELKLIDTIYDLYPGDPDRTLYLSIKDEGIRVKTAQRDLGHYTALRLASPHKGKEFRIASSNIERAYEGELQLRPYRNYLQIVNIVDLENYVAGVVESESKPEDELEYYKTQAILARTFALRNLEKHINEGYNLKDDVTSQVYLSKCHFTYCELIRKAVAATGDTIMVSDKTAPILSVFHANSGGQTVGAEDAWLKPISYLRARKDSFSVGVGSYAWEKKIPKTQFYAYFARYLGVPNSGTLQQALLKFKQPERQSHFHFQGKSIKLTAVRRDFHLRSTFFSVYDANEYVLLKGHGYGHGVGLSQDGALEMARKGFDFKEILYFYFDNVTLQSIKNLKEKT